MAAGFLLTELLIPLVMDAVGEPARTRMALWEEQRRTEPTLTSYSRVMAGGTKRLPRAVREQQMLDAAVQMFSINGYHETSMDAIAAEAEISKPMLYLYYGSKEELFGACLDRELGRFIDRCERTSTSVEPERPAAQHNVSFLRYIDANRASWIVMYTQATSSQAFAHTVREGRERIIELVAGLVQSGTRHPEPMPKSKSWPSLSWCGRGGGQPGQHRRRRRRRGGPDDDQPVLAGTEGRAERKGRRGRDRDRRLDRPALGQADRACGRHYARHLKSGLFV